MGSVYDRGGWRPTEEGLRYVKFHGAKSRSGEPGSKHFLTTLPCACSKRAEGG
jgi:hypothetical protein